jgi:hypothetical protein
MIGKDTERDSSDTFQRNTKNLPKKTDKSYENFWAG